MPETTVDNLARIEAEVLDKVPLVEPWRSRWCCLHALHGLALVHDYRSAGRLADARFLQYCNYQGAVLAGHIRPHTVPVPKDPC